MQYPLGQARNHAPFLAMLEEKMGQKLKHPVTFDVYFFKPNQEDSHPILRGIADFELMETLTYIKAREVSPDIQVLAQEETSGDAVIFARKELGITSLQGIAGQRVAFAHTNSTVGLLAKVQMAKAGVYADSFKLYTNLPYRDPLPADLRDLDDEAMPEKELTQQVLKGSFDVGEVQRHLFEMYRFKGRGLNELGSYSIPDDVYVARQALSPDVAQAFQKALMSLTSKKEKEILEALQITRIAGFSAVQASNFNRLQDDLKTWLPKFENEGSAARH